MFEIIIFLLGIVLGISLSFLVIFSYLYFAFRGKNKLDDIIKKAEERIKPKVKIFMPPSNEEEAQEEIIKRNQEKGRETKAEELGI